MNSNRASTLLDGGPSQHSTPPPLALHDFLGQKAPASPFAYSTSSFSSVVNDPADAGLPVETPDSTELKQEPETARSEPLLDTEPTMADAPNWVSIRTQLLPGKSNGKKADWIRGWSESVGAYGGDTYCACSETVITVSGGVLFAATGLGIKQKRNLPKGLVTNCQQEDSADGSSTGATDLCRNCSRPPSPPIKSAFGTSTSLDNDEQGYQARTLRHRVSVFFKRVMLKRGDHSQSQSQSLYAERLMGNRKGNASFPSHQTHPDLAFKLSKDRDTEKTHDNAEDLVDPDDLSSSSDGQKPRAQAALAARNARLERARAQLEVMNGNGG